jgi:cholesterol transport system auxiliary component
MLAPLLAEAMNATGEFQALYATPGAFSARYRLDTELIRIHQDFTQQPSSVHITLRAQLVSMGENRVIATRLFDVREASETEDAYGGVQAANRATVRLLAELAQFCISSTNN